MHALRIVRYPKYKSGVELIKIKLYWDSKFVYSSIEAAFGKETRFLYRKIKNEYLTEFT